LAQAIVSFFAIIDPVGNILVFHLYTRAMDGRHKLYAALIAVGAAFVLLLAFSLGGREVLDFLGISPDSFQVAAGLLLLPPAYRLVTEGQPAAVEHPEDLQPFDFALVPMAMPLIAGPGALAATTSFTERLGTETTIAAVVVVLAVTLVAFVAAEWLFRVAGISVLKVLSRVVGVVLFAIAVDFILEGAREFATAGSV
jgi:multiple antibiotic resistance protein